MTFDQIEGTWEEILTHAPDLEGHRLRVILLDDVSEHEQSISDALKAKKLKALRTFASDPLSDVPPLSDEAMSRESIYAEQG
ncbi:hypothetical protein C1752_00995 [Acaryochloris thomasi RCC1774]|uniref:Uncharacterized protein n=1 Tax=Acaryochloris thomasi RCC1774 TaxID=1764569 RepID=A0A2W1K008_9CYAN|nr:hypothetical protein [Acaryochloris thomasi]PZD74934.1 hypothetical protein C1752_00995 [Acaryochloris thomasi RCC1774]